MEGVVCGGVVTSDVLSLITVDIKQVNTHERENEHVLSIKMLF